MSGLSRAGALPGFAASLLLVACVSVDVGSGGGPQQKLFVFDAPRAATQSGAATQAGAAKAERPVLRLEVVSGDPMADTTSIAYSKRAGERATYQLASWTEPPVRRLAQVVQRRLESRGKVEVVQLGQPVEARALMVLSIESIVHDLSGDPDRAHLSVRAELIDRDARKRIDLQTFSAQPAVEEANSSAAVDALNRALDQVLEQLAPWVEAHMAKLPEKS